MSTESLGITEGLPTANFRPDGGIVEVHKEKEKQKQKIKQNCKEADYLAFKQVLHSIEIKIQILHLDDGCHNVLNKT